jgi:Na+-translocating ferredoxin:NAD+ oxidoreductase RNF subunit RnfB
MPAQTGQRAKETGTFHCRGCAEAVRVRKGERIPECPCGGTTFTSRTHELDTRRKRRKAGTSPKSAARRTPRGRAAKKKSVRSPRGRG